MKKINYNFWFAILYEVLKDLADHFPRLKRSKIVKLILRYCKHDWVLWKIDNTLNDVDKQVEQIKKDWAKADIPTSTYIEHPADGSKAQELLGGAMEIRSNFKRE